MNRKLARIAAQQRCWANIGSLGGDRSCTVLQQVGSCRECDVIAVATDDLLARPLESQAPSLALASRPLTPGALREGGALPRAAAFSPVTNHALRLAVVTFQVAEHSLAIDVSRVVEVGAPRPIRRVPHRARSGVFLGLVNVLGKLEPCFALPTVLGLEGSHSLRDNPTATEANAPAAVFGATRLLVVGDEAHRCAFLAERVALAEVDLSTVADPPATLAAALGTHVRGILRFVGGQSAWLDVDKLIATLERSLT